MKTTKKQGEVIVYYHAKLLEHCTTHCIGEGPLLDLLHRVMQTIVLQLAQINI